MIKLISNEVHGCGIEIRTFFLVEGEITEVDF